MFIHHHLLLILDFLLCIFFFHLPIFALANNFPTPHSHLAAFTHDYKILLDSLHISEFTRKPLLGSGRPYLIANVVILLITLLNIIVYKLRQHHEDSTGQKSTSSSSNLSSEQPCRRFSLEEIVSATNNFNSSLVIGKGGFGKVYKGIIDNGASTVAIKRLNSLSKQGATEFWTEINMLSKFRHSHLVSLIGYCDENDEMIIVYEYMIHGSLAEHLHKFCKDDNNGNTSLSWVKRLKICIGAARGLDYLHTGTSVLQRVIHRDVKSSNILLDGNWAAKISDFGLSRIGLADQEYTTHVSTKHIKGTFGYMDPDYFLTRRITRKSDVYAFGVVLLEILSERPALDRSLDEDKRSLVGWGQHCVKVGAIHKLIGPNLGCEIFPDSLTEFVKIADQCLHSSPKQRPTMSEVVSRLELALALQLRTNLVTEEYSFSISGPFSNPEEADSYPLPSVEGLRISGEPFLGREIEVSGYCINGTTSCQFQWVRHLEDGSFQYIDDGTEPIYIITIDDADTYLEVEVQPLDDRMRKGVVLKVRANENRKIKCDPELSQHITRNLYNGHVTYRVSLSTGDDIWEPAVLTIKCEGYSIKCTRPGAVLIGTGDGIWEPIDFTRNCEGYMVKIIKPSAIVFTEKFTTSIIFNFSRANPTEFSIDGTKGVQHVLRADESSQDLACSRDAIVLTLRSFASRAIEKKKGWMRSLFFKK